jgi:RNA polymerase sigma-70 factor (ECF subfamily)
MASDGTSPEAAIEAGPNGGEAAVVRAGDESGFAELAERYRRELRVHCYRMLGSFEESEDLVQETFLRAWRGLDGFEGRSTFRAWLYRIATNACLDFLERHPRRPVPREGVREPSDIAWLQPYPDRLLEPLAFGADEPDTAAVARETIELAFLAAIQRLPPRQRAVLILRDVLGWPAGETAEMLEVSVAAVKSALQRARPVLKEQLPERRLEWGRSAEPSGEERELLRRYMNAFEQADPAALAGLLREDVRLTMPPLPRWWYGPEPIVSSMHADLFAPGPGHVRVLLAEANRQPAAALYLRRSGDSTFRAQGLNVLRLEGDRIAEIMAFFPDRFPALGLPMIL